MLGPAAVPTQGGSRLPSRRCAASRERASAPGEHTGSNREYRTDRSKQTPGPAGAWGGRVKIARMTSRRALLRAGLGAGLIAALGGCGLRMERDSPALLPGVPTLEPPADQGVLRAAITRLRVVAAATRGDAALATRHAEQLRRLIAVAAGAGVSAPPTPATAAAIPQAAAAESAQLGSEWLTQVAGATDRNRPMLAAILASHQWALRSLDGTALPVRIGLAPADAAVVLRRLWVATYAAEQLIARTPVKQRAALSTLLTSLYAERSRLTGEAGASASGEPLTYALPSNAGDPAAARAVMGPLLADIVTACASVSTGGSRAASIARLTQLWGDSAALASQWGRPPGPFLGLS